MKIIDKFKELNNQPIKLEKLEKVKFYFLLFFIGCVIGWIYEEIFFLVTENILENRGFLYGPYLPVYGVGSVLMVMTLKRFKKNPVVFFILSAVVTGVLEYITGALMWAIWHQKWWSYDGLFLNIGGYVCFRSVISFAIGGLALIYFLDPLLARIMKKLSTKNINIISIVLAVIVIIDFIITLSIRHPIVF